MLIISLQNAKKKGIIIMSNKFIYTYSAEEKDEIERIRKKYLPREESKLDELKRLDRSVEKSGMIASVTVGIIGSLILGFGMCMAMQVIGSGALTVTLGVITGIIGIAIMLITYPVFRKLQEKAKAKFAPRILELTDKLSSENNA